jgi:hypothetical protein
MYSREASDDGPVSWEVVRVGNVGVDVDVGVGEWSHFEAEVELTFKICGGECKHCLKMLSSLTSALSENENGNGNVTHRKNCGNSDEHVEGRRHSEGAALK